MPDPAARAVVSDDGSTIWLTAYTATGEAVPVALHPVRAVALAGELIERQTEDPTRLLNELTAQALARGQRLEELSVGRPTLEDLYLELTADG